MVLFVLSCGLAVTLGLMNFVNLAHGALAMAGGYTTVVLMQRFDWSFVATLPLAFLLPALIGVALERTLYVRMYKRTHLDQVLFTIGLVFMAVAATDWVMGSQQLIIKLPDWLRGRTEVLGVGIGRYRLFIIVLCSIIAVALQLALTRTRFGGRLRAAVDDARVARGLGIPVASTFAITFALGSGLAGLGGALSADILGLDPTFPLKYMIYFLIIVTVGGTAGLAGPFIASLLLGIADVAGKYYVPEVGAFVIYAVMIAVLLVRPQGLFGQAPSVAQASGHDPGLSHGPKLQSGTRATLEIAFWVLAFATWVLLPKQSLLLNEVAILALFAISLDLILGYAGIVSLGHAAFLGIGAYAAGLVAKHVTGDPLIGLATAGLAAGGLGLLSSLLVLRGVDLTRLMVTLGVALVLGEIANSWRSLTGGADGLQGISMSPLLGIFPFDLRGRTAFAYSLTVLFVCFLISRRLMASPFGASLRAIRDNRLRAAAIGIPVERRLITVYTIAAVMAGLAGALLAQTTQFVSLDVLEFHRSADLMLVLIIGGAGYLYGGVIGAVIFKLLQDMIAIVTPQYWQFWIGFVLVVFVLLDRQRLAARIAGLMRSAPSPSAASTRSAS
jgi:branched-chain amino acid transport system permease protein